MSTIVPWTNVGGVPCCCEQGCAFPTEPLMPNKTEYDIDATLYAAMYAGGEVAITGAGSGSTTSQQGDQTCSISGNVAADLLQTLQTNRCISAVASTSGSTGFQTNRYVHYLDHAVGTEDYKVFFDLDLGYQAGKSCAVGLEAVFVTVNSTYILGDQGTSGTFNCGFGSTCLKTVTPSTLSVTLNGGDQTYNFSVPTYQANFNSGFPIFLTYISLSGAVSGSFVYSPSAP